VRRVLLKPAPLEVVSTALTQDELKLTLTVSVKYEVENPVYVASLADPLAELRNFFEGIAAECIRSRPLLSFLSDEGELRNNLKDRYQNALTIKGKYIIHDVLKAIPSGDESLIEINRKTRAAAHERNLIQVEGINREVESHYNLKIAREEAKLNEEMAQLKHEREKEIRELEARSEIMKTAISTLGQVASAGIDPTKLTKEVIGTLVDRVQNARFASDTAPALPEANPNGAGG
jgi:hypothetical protein